MAGTVQVRSRGAHLAAKLRTSFAPDFVPLPGDPQPTSCSCRLGLTPKSSPIYGVQCVCVCVTTRRRPSAPTRFRRKLHRLQVYLPFARVWSEGVSSLMRGSTAPRAATSGSLVIPAICFLLAAVCVAPAQVRLGMVWVVAVGGASGGRQFQPGGGES